MGTHGKDWWRYEQTAYYVDGLLRLGYATGDEAFITKVPTVWDETVGVAGEIGKYAVVARRKGGEWWLGAITNWDARELEIPTTFLGEGEWKAEAFEDAADADVNAEHYVRRTFTITAGEPLKVRLAPGGGFAAKFKRKKTSIRVMTYNIRYSEGDRESPKNNWNVRKDDLVDLIVRENPDVVGFQEVLPEQMEFLKSRLSSYTFVGEYRNADRKSGEASPIAFKSNRFKAVKCGTFWLSETPDAAGSISWGAKYPRVCSYAVLDDAPNGRRFAFANTHTDHKSEEAREKGMLLVVERMKEFAGDAPIVFTGDHNCLEFDKCAMSVKEKLDDALYRSETPPEGPWRTCTHWVWREQEVSTSDALKLPPEKRSATGDDAERIDYIYATPGTRVLGYRTIPDTRPGVKLYPSDHFPIVADIVL
jgi:endonuclease/exonuclease/phosphatase family metal-dependent hydrolase